MSEKFSQLCPLCKNPLEFGDHTKCKTSRLRENRYKEEGDLRQLENRAKQNLELLSPEERESLTESGHAQLEVKENAYKAMSIFKSLQDFEGLRKTADYLLHKRPMESWDLLDILTDLEDYEGLRNLLNLKAESGVRDHRGAFRTLEKPILEYVEKFLNENKTPDATGIINYDVDIIAIRHFAKEFDIAVPIARGGLAQGAIAHLWGMPTRTVDIAAHNRKVARGKWVDSASLADFEGKDVLLFDKDAVTGATIQKMVKMLTPFKPASISVYFAHPVLPKGSMGGTRVEGLPAGLKVYSPHNAPLEKAGDVYIEAHEKLGTEYGRRHLVERLYTEEFIPNLKKQYPDLAMAVEEFISKHMQVYDSLNQFLPGIEKVREQILSKLKIIHHDYAGFADLQIFELPHTREAFKRILETTQPLSVGFENDLVNARYQKQAETSAQKRGVENPHNPNAPLAAFHTARGAAKDGFKIALIVGPEGFSYEPYFNDLGIQTVAVNIPESGEGEARTIQLFDNLSSLKGEKVLVVEDDVRTGATLQKVMEALKQHKPRELGLYLGQPESFQLEVNIPPDFKNTYVAGANVDSDTMAKEFREYLESKGLRIFKQTSKVKKTNL